ncbi:MAG TPA: 16S rRNA (uracil(1498)-N(3))-methyltransferase [Nitrospirae bacterium]|nr:ribosomal RNA small subunit methyltransferase E [bacterium BMS3Abin06]HDH11619.1 16S rRNA (uracil(1498)-N(3))-methyltransferase [Nitrospirota bacterium]HDZ02039.1 16S rRNA (uracil(1498)-N(3))-methyltransferase [Nitrospirota bacterium]
MLRLFLPPEKLSSKQITITGDNARYLSLVMRVRPGDPLIIFDGLGYKYSCKILQCHKKEIVVEKISKAPYSVESPVSITLAQGIAKGDKMDFIIQKSTELGVRKIIPLITARTQIRHTDKIERWRKIASSASRQSGRDRIPEIDEPVDIREFLDSIAAPLAGGNTKGVKESEGGFGIIFSEEKKERHLKEVLSSLKDTKNITILIGPEGGFPMEEVTAAVEKGFTEASLGPRILRTETAPLAALCIIQYELGDMG